MTDIIKIAKAITSLDLADEQKRAAAPLVETYITCFAEDKGKFRTLAVENPWFLWLNDWTLLVGVMDANRVDIETGEFEELELKTRRAPRMKKNGEPYKGDTEADWVDELVNSAQVGIYALARAKATFLTPLPPVESPRIRVRCAVKSDPPALWPAKDNALFSFGPPFLAQIGAAALSASHSILARRVAGTVPYQLMGHWCKRYNRDCEFLESVCKPRLNGKYLVPLEPFNSNDPGAAAIAAGLLAAPKRGVSATDIVILSASAYTDYCGCAEHHRLRSGGWFEPEDSEALGIGTAFHAGVGEFNKLLMEEKSERIVDSAS